MDYDKILQTILDIGEEMVVAGAEISRVEDSILIMAESYGCDRVNVFLITSNLQVTVETPDGKILTHIRVIERNDVNFDRLDYLNDLSRMVCEKTPDVDVIKREFHRVMDRKSYPWYIKLLGSLLGVSAFTCFFGGGWKDVCVACLMGLVMYLLGRVLDNIENNVLVLNFVLAFAGSLVVLVTSHMIPELHPGRIMMGGIILLTPGVAFTNSVRDMLIGDTAGGLLRLVNAILISVAIACGYALGIVILGGGL